MTVERKRWIRRSMVLICMVLGAAFAGTGGADDLPFVTGAFWHQPRGVSVQMRLRNNLPPSGSGGEDSNAAARKLTSQMKQDMKSAAELLDLLDRVVDGPIFNTFHASAAYHSLATWKRNGGLTPSDKSSPVLPRLAARVQNLVEEGQVGPREVANVYWSLGQLSDDLEVPEGLLMALVKWLGEKASGMGPQELSKSLFAFVQLKGVAPEVLTALPELAAQVSIKAKDMIPQHIPNSLWAAICLKDDAPEVLQMVPALVEEIPQKQASFDSQSTCNCLVALILLQDLVPEVGNVVAATPNSKTDFVGFATSRFSTLLPKLKGKDLEFAVPVVVWACARVKRYDEKLLDSVAQRLKSGRDLKALPDWGLCALLWSYDVLDPDGRFSEFKNALESERVRRGLSDSDVSESASKFE